MFIIKEATMNFKKALNVFGLSEVPESETLKKLYKKLSIENHPDRGGSQGKMKDINLAYEILKNTQQSKNKKSDDVWKTIRKKKENNRKIFVPKMIKMFKDIFNEKEVLDYFSFLNEDLQIKADVSELKSSYDVGVQAIISIFNKEKTSVVETVFYVKYNQNSSNGLTYSDIDEKDVMYSVSVSTSFYHNNKKIKISQRDYNWNIGMKKFVNFSEIYPIDKMLKAIAKSSSKKFRKEDMLLGLKRELNANINGSDIFLYPFGKDVKFYICVSRQTFNRLPFYHILNIQAIHPKTKKYKPFRFKRSLYFYEDEESFRKFADAIKNTVKEIEKKKLNLIESYDIVCNIFQSLFENLFPKNY